MFTATIIALGTSDFELPKLIIFTGKRWHLPIYIYAVMSNFKCTQHYKLQTLTYILRLVARNKCTILWVDYYIFCNEYLVKKSL